mgnify:FL=1
MEKETENKADTKEVIHVVKQGDTLYKIAQEHDVNLFELMSLNPYVNVYNLQIGDEIVIPAIKQND